MVGGKGREHVEDGGGALFPRNTIEGIQKLQFANRINSMGVRDMGGDQWCVCAGVFLKCQALRTRLETARRLCDRAALLSPYRFTMIPVLSNSRSWVLQIPKKLCNIHRKPMNPKLANPSKSPPPRASYNRLLLDKQNELYDLEQRLERLDKSRRRDEHVSPNSGRKEPVKQIEKKFETYRERP